MNYNILDEFEDDFSPRSAEFRIGGLTAAAQRRLLKDVARKAAFERELGGGSKNFANVKDYAGELENRMDAMPEKFQDAFLKTVSSPDYPTTFGHGDAGEFVPSTKATNIGYDLKPYAYIHEGTHALMNRLKRGHDYVRPASFYTPAEVIAAPDASVENDIGGAFHSDFAPRLKWLYDRYYLPIDKPSDPVLLDYVVNEVNRLPGFDNLGLDDAKRTVRNVLDNVGMDPDMPGLENFGHGSSYQLDNSWVANHFASDPERYSPVTKEAARRAALSIEGAAHMGELMGTPGAEEFLNNFPVYRDRFLDVVGSDNSPTSDDILEYNEIGDTPYDIGDWRYVTTSRKGVPRGFRSKAKMMDYVADEAYKNAKRFYDGDDIDVYRELMRFNKPKAFYIDKGGNMKQSDIPFEFMDDYLGRKHR